MYSMAGIQQKEQPITETLSVIIDKILTIAAVVAVLLGALMALHVPPATGYELTIYDAYPANFWGFMVVAFICGVAILLHHAFSDSKSNWWVAGIFVVMLVNSFLLMLPFLHGYAFYPGGDAMDHIGMMDDIETTGHIGFQNFYPIVHLLGISLRYIGEIPDNTIITLMVIFFNLMFLSGIYLLSTVIARNRGQSLLIVAFACPFFFSNLHGLIHPSVLCIYMLPLFLYAYHKATLPGSRQLCYKILLIILAITITYIHPVSCIFAMVLILVINFGEMIYNRRIQRDASTTRTPVKTNFNILLIIFVIFCAWYFSFGLIQSNIRAVYIFFTSGDSESLFTQQTTDLANAGITLRQIIMLILNQYGTVLIYAALSGLGFIRLLRTNWNTKSPQPSSIGFTYALLLIVGVFFTIFSLFGFTGEMSPIRVARFFLLIAPMVMGIFIYEIATKRYQNLNWLEMKLKGKMVVAIAAVMILIAGSLGIFNLYGSPRITVLNAQITQMDINGTKWFGLHQNKQIIVDGINMNFRSFEHFNFGLDTNPLERTIYDTEVIPNNFGYDKSDSIRETYGFSNRYLVISQLDRIFPYYIPENVRWKTHQYTGTGYDKLYADPGASKVYANDQFESWLVK